MERLAGHFYDTSFVLLTRLAPSLVEDDAHLLTVLKYVERNAVRAHLCERAEYWRWGSAFQRIQTNMHRPQILSELPTPLPENYRDWINTPDPAEELKSVRHSITKGIPYGGESWQQQMIDEYDLEQTTRSPGRPRKD